MDDFESLAIEEAIQSQIGETATYQIYDRTIHNPMNLVLDEAERQLSETFRVFWVEGGLPEIFTLSGFTITPVIYNSRYLEIAAFIRQVMIVEWSSDSRAELAERVCLRLMAELCLRYGQPDLAVLAFLKSVIGQHIWVFTDELVDDLEIQPKNEAYMSTWFFSLIHEIGHAVPPVEDSLGLFSDASIQNAIMLGLEFIPVPDELKERALEEAIKQPSSYPLGIEHVRREALADFFAAVVLLRATNEILQEGGKKLDFINMITELVIFINVVIIVERCKKTVLIGSNILPDRTAKEQALLSPVSFYARAYLMNQTLTRLYAAFLSNSDNPSEELIEQCSQRLNEINQSMQENLEEFEKGMARSMRFFLFPDEREPDLLDQFDTEVSNAKKNLIARIEAEKFCALADSLGAAGEMVKGLRQIMNNTRQRITTGGQKNQVYIVPWVKGPGNFEQPFGLDTKYGHLVLVFVEQSDLYQTFFDNSAGALVDGFTLETTAIIAADRKQLNKELAARMPSGMRFGVVVQGTEAFTQFMQELADDTIWAEE